MTDHLLPRAAVSRHNQQVWQADFKPASHPHIYKFKFESWDADAPSPSEDCWTVERSYLIGAREKESIWNDIAKIEANHFKRIGLDIEYPSCAVTFLGDELF